MRVQLALLLALAATLLTACGSAQERSAKYLERAREYMEEEDYVKARLDLRNAIKIDKDNVEARLLLGEIAEQNQNYDQLYDQMQRVIAIDPENVEARVKVGLVQLAASQNRPEILEQVHEHLAVALEHAPDDPDVRLLEATLANREGRVQEALTLVRALRENHPQYTGAVSLEYSILMEAGDFDGAIAALDAGIADNPDAVALQLVRLKAFERREQWEEVEAGLLQISEQLPDAKAVRYELAKLYVKLERLDEAEQVLDALRERFPDDTTAKLTYAEFLARHRTTEDAERILQQYAANEPDVPAFGFALATLYTFDERLAEAGEIYRELIATAGEPDDQARARTELAKLLLRQERFEEARELLDAVLAEVENDPEARIVRAGLEIRDGELDAAIADLRAARRNDPDSRRALTLLAQAHLRAGDNGLAEERMRDLLRAYPDDVFSRDQLATLLLRSGRFDETVEVIRDATQAGAPRTTTSVRLLTDALVRDGRAEEALSEAQQLIVEAEARDGTALAALGHLLAGRSLEAMQRPEEALAEYEAGREAGGLSPELLSGLVSALTSLGRTDEALAELDGVIAENPDSFAALTMKGQLLAREGRLAEAREVLERSLDAQGALWATYRDLIKVNVGLGDLDGAIAVARRALDASPASPRVHMALAQLYERGARYPEAMTAYENVLQAEPNSLVAVNNLAALIADHDASPERLAYAEELVRPLRNEANPMFLDTAGWVSYRAGNLTDAIPLLEQAVREAAREPALAGQLAQLRYHLGMAYASMDQAEAARRELSAAVESGNDFVGRDQAEQTLAQLGRGDGR